MSPSKKAPAGEGPPEYPGTLTKPTTTREADYWRFQWPEENGPESCLALEFGQVREAGEGIYAELEVKFRPPSVNGKPPPFGHIWGPVKLNLTGPQGRSSAINALSNGSTGSALWRDSKTYSLRWRDMIELAYRQVVTEFREGSPTLNLVSDVQEITEVRYLVSRLCPLNQTSVLYCDGGLGKSWLAMYIGALVAMGASIPPFSVNGCDPVLYLDWEVDETEARRRIGWIARGLGFDQADLDSRFLYRRMERPIAEDLGRIRRDVARYGIGLVIIDSIVPASGGDPNAADVARSAMQAIRNLYPATRLVVAHISKADARQNADNGRESGVYGNAFYRNLGRSLWEMRVDKLGGIYEVGLIHRKVNVGRLQDPFGLRYDWDEATRSFSVQPIAVDRSVELAKAVGIEMQIKALLAENGSMTVDALKKATGRSEYLVLKALTNLSDEVEKYGGGLGRGNKASYRLVRPGDTLEQGSLG